MHLAHRRRRRLDRRWIHLVGAEPQLAGSTLQIFMASDGNHSRPSAVADRFVIEPHVATIRVRSGRAGSRASAGEQTGKLAGDELLGIRLSAPAATNRIAMSVDRGRDLVCRCLHDPDVGLRTQAVGRCSGASQSDASAEVVVTVALFPSAETIGNRIELRQRHPRHGKALRRLSCCRHERTRWKSGCPICSSNVRSRG